LKIDVAPLARSLWPSTLSGNCNRADAGGVWRLGWLAWQFPLTYVSTVEASRLGRLMGSRSSKGAYLSPCQIPKCPEGLWALAPLYSSGRMPRAAAPAELEMRHLGPIGGYARPPGKGGRWPRPAHALQPNPPLRPPPPPLPPPNQARHIHGAPDMPDTQHLLGLALVAPTTALAGSLVGACTVVNEVGF
jgi:hypothetical protein